MLNKIKAFFHERIEHGSEQGDSLGINLAAAALLIEVLKADFQPDPREERAIKQALHTHLNIGEEEIDELFLLAAEEAESATSLFQFTRLVNEQYEPQQKYRLICAMWQVAYADQVLDAHEQHLIRQIADLIHVSHQDFIRAKQEMRPDL